MRYRILGPLEVDDGTRVVPLAQGRQRLLLAVLLVHPNEAISNDRLIDALWGEAPPPTAARSLHNLISSLRKGLGDGQLVTRGHGYLLQVAEGELDAQRFEALSDQGRAALAAGDPARAADLLREALALWRGPALADLAYEPAVSDEGARLEDWRLATLEDRFEADLALGRHAELVPELEAAVARNPLRERLTGQLMLALYRSGRQADALQAYGDARRRLVEELGIEPGPALRQLERAVLDQDPALGSPDPLPPPPGPRPAAPVVAAARRRPFAVAGAGALMLAGALVALVLALGSGSGTAGLRTLAGNSLAAIDPHTNRIVADVSVGGTPTSVAVGAGAVWALNADDQTIARIDPKTKRARTFGIGETPTDLAAVGDALWVGSGLGIGAEHVLRLGADDLIVHARIALPSAGHQGAPGQPGQLAVGPGAVWAINDGEDLVRIDSRTGRVTARVRPLLASAVAAAGGSVWALASDSTTVVLVDARTATVRDRIRLQATRLDAIAAGAGAVWVADSDDGTLWRIDPGPRTITRTIPVGVGANGVAVGAGAVWVTNGLRGTVVRVDPRANRVTATVVVGNTPRDVAVGAGSVWTSLAGSAAPAPAPAASATSPRAVPRSICGRVFAGAGPPDHLIVSDLPLKAGQLGPPTLAMANAVAFVLREHHFRAGRFQIGYQSCDDSTAATRQDDPTKCEANAKAYAATPAVVGVVGPLNSGCATPEIPILNRAPGGPLAIISPTNTQLGLTQVDPTAPRGDLGRLYPTGVRNYARVAPADDAQAAADVVLARRLGVHRLYLLDDGSDYGRPLAALIRRAARRLGLRLAGTARWDRSGKGFRALAERVRRARADGVFESGLLDFNGGPLTKALRARLGARIPLIAGDAFGPIYALWDNSDGAAKGMYVSMNGLPVERLGARGRRFLRQFGATQRGVTVDFYVAYAAAATEVLLDAIARSDGTRASVTRQLLATRLSDGILGPVSFDRNGDITRPPVTILRVRRRARVTDVSGTEGAAIDRVIVPPPSALR
jgi:DNA-binding SARP family transcriptional activator/ABC-type branched-subunit amino acid transport system substrate-binding protein/streptogramin lyase